MVETMAVSMFCRTLDADAAATALQVFHFMFTVGASVTPLTANMISEHRDHSFHHNQHPTNLALTFGFIGQTQHTRTRHTRPTLLALKKRACLPNCASAQFGVTLPSVILCSIVAVVGAVLSIGPGTLACLKSPRSKVVAEDTWPGRSQSVPRKILIAVRHLACLA